MTDYRVRPRSTPTFSAFTVTAENIDSIAESVDQAFVCRLGEYASIAFFLDRNCQDAIYAELGQIVVFDRNIRIFDDEAAMLAAYEVA